MDEIIPTVEPIKKENFFISRIKKYQVIAFTFIFLFLNQIIIASANYFTGKEKYFENDSSNILLIVLGIPLIYFLGWLIVVWIASKLPREKLKEKFSNHPIATIIIFFLLIISELPNRLADYWDGNLINVFEVIVYYSFIFFPWWLLVCWISEKIFKRQKFEWIWYKKIIDKMFIFLAPLYKFILGLLAALFIIMILFLLVTLVFHYSWSDLKHLFQH